MTPPIPRMRIDSLPVRPPRVRVGGPHRKGQDLLCYAQRAWALGPKGDVNIPVWYSGQYGVPNRFLRKPSKDSTSKEKALGLIVRMNHMLDYPYLYGMDSRTHFFCLNARRIRVLCRSIGPLFIGDRGRGFTPVWSMNTSYSLSVDYNWKSALACTLRNFVHFVGVLRDPNLAFSRHSPGVNLESLPLSQTREATLTGSHH